MLAELARVGRIVGFEVENSETLIVPSHQKRLALTKQRQLVLAEDLGEAVERAVDTVSSINSSPVNSDTVPSNHTPDEKSSAAFDARPSKSQTMDAERMTKSTSPSKVETTKRKSRRKGNVIDNLFQGL